MSDPTGPVRKIVCLEAFFCPIPEFDTGKHTLEVEVHDTTPRNDKKILHERLRDANVTIITTMPLDAETLAPEVTPKLKAVMVMSVGTDNVDLKACRARGIKVFNCPAANADSVAEHAIALYFAVRRRLVEQHLRTVQGQWAVQGSLLENMKDRRGHAPLSLKDEKAGIVGYGAIGRNIASLCSALGMSVSIAGRRALGSSQQLDNGRVPFEDVLRQSTVLFICVPLNADTANLISSRTLDLMRPEMILINVSRGGVVNEDSLVQALKEGVITGAATDVFAIEPAAPVNSPLLRSLDDDTGQTLPLVVSPHMAWYSQATVANLQSTMKQNVEGWLAGSPPAHTAVV